MSTGGISGGSADKYAAIQDAQQADATKAADKQNLREDSAKDSLNAALARDARGGKEQVKKKSVDMKSRLDKVKEAQQVHKTDEKGGEQREAKAEKFVKEHPQFSKFLLKALADKVGEEGKNEDSILKFVQEFIPESGDGPTDRHLAFNYLKEAFESDPETLENIEKAQARHNTGDNAAIIAKGLRASTKAAEFAKRLSGEDGEVTSLRALHYAHRDSNDKGTVDILEELISQYSIGEINEFLQGMCREIGIDLRSQSSEVDAKVSALIKETQKFQAIGGVISYFTGTVKAIRSEHARSNTPMDSKRINIRSLVETFNGIVAPKFTSPQSVERAFNTSFPQLVVAY